MTNIDKVKETMGNRLDPELVDKWGHYYHTAGNTYSITEEFYITFDKDGSFDVEVNNYSYYHDADPYPYEVRKKSDDGSNLPIIESCTGMWFTYNDYLVLHIMTKGKDKIPADEAVVFKYRRDDDERSIDLYPLANEYLYRHPLYYY